jgi:ligand-binding sensor domain-containing protein
MRTTEHSMSRLFLIRFAVFLGVLIASTRSPAQLRSLNVSQYLHTSWRAEDGSFRGGFASITQSRDGYLWIAGDFGAIRFDGVHFVEWTPPRGQALPTPLDHVYASSDGSVWFGGLGLGRLAPDGSYQRYPALDGIPVNCVMEAPNGEIWVGVNAKMGHPPLFRVVEGDVRPIQGDPSPKGRVVALYVDHHQHLLAAAQDGVWEIHANGSRKIASYPDFFYLADLNEDDAGNLLLANGEDLKEIDSSGKILKYKPLKGHPQLEISILLRARNGDLWMTTVGNGLVHLHHGKIDIYSTRDGLSQSFARGILQDREGNIWVLSSNSLDRFTAPSVAYVTTREGLPNDVVPAVLTDREGTTWVSTFGGLATIRGDQVLASKFRLPGKVAVSLFQSSGGRLLVGCGLRAAWIKGTKMSLSAFNAGDVLGMVEDKRKHLWLLSHDLGLVHVDAKGNFVKAYKEFGINTAVRTLAYDPTRDAIWLGSSGGDVLLFKNGRVVVRYGRADGFPSVPLTKFSVDSSGALLMSSRAGIVRFANDKVSILDSRNGLPCDAAGWLEHDGQGHVWLRLECGLAEFSEIDFSRWTKDPTSHVKVERFLDNTSGVPFAGGEGWYTPASAKTSDGLIVSGSMSGLSVFDPRDLRTNSLPPPVHIETIRADGRELRPSTSMQLGKRTRDLQFSFTALSYSAPTKVRFRYQLEGYDKGWSDPVSFRNVTYTNLPPGPYRFRVIACNNDGVWNEQGDAISLYIPPAFTQTWGFAAMCLAVFCVLAYIVYHLRLRHVASQLRQNFWVRLQERERIARELHDTFFQGVQGLFLQIDAVVVEMRKDDSLRPTLEGLLAQSDGIMLQGREVVTELRKGAGDGSELIIALSDFGQHLTSLHPAQFRSQTIGEPLPLKSGVAEEIEKIAKESIRNAFQHANATQITLEVTFSLYELHISVRDDGSGIDPSILVMGRRRGHFGLPGMRERARLIGAHLVVRSHQPSGTTIEVTVPTRHAYRDSPPLLWLRARWKAVEASAKLFWTKDPMR